MYLYCVYINYCNNKNIFDDDIIYDGGEEIADISDEEYIVEQISDKIYN